MMICVLRSPSIQHFQSFPVDAVTERSCQFKQFAQDCFSVGTGKLRYLWYCTAVEKKLQEDFLLCNHDIVDDLLADLILGGDDLKSSKKGWHAYYHGRSNVGEDAVLSIL